MVGRDAVGMRGHPALADIDVAFPEQFAQMVVGPAVAEPQLEHEPVEVADRARRRGRGRRAAPQAGG